MSVPQPLTRGQVSEELKEIFDSFKDAFGFVPNFFGVMSRRPGVLKALVPFADAIMREGIVEGKYRELAFLKASTLNRCVY